MCWFLNPILLSYNQNFATRAIIVDDDGIYTLKRHLISQYVSVLNVGLVISN